MTLALARHMACGRIHRQRRTRDPPRRTRADPRRVGRNAHVDVLRADVSDTADVVRNAVGVRADLVWASAVVHHLGAQQGAVHAFTGLLAPGGRLALAEGGLPARHLPGTSASESLA
ncbi:methyltransferase domain-containing protein [Micromonospora sp. SL1-18]|uniref:methyltransferase domain-containing protein n=1 Tax=Micromonospora sp. SL1-18 TaxID=3399128 RepID=UPI003A4D7A26